MLNRFVLTVTIVCAAVFAVAPAQSAENQTVPGRQVKFISGGVGADGAERMAALSKDFNLKLVFAAKDGHYLADVKVVVSDARGARVIDVVSEGPFFLANVAPGKYQVNASYAGESFSRDTTVPAAGQRELIFRWAEPGQ